MEDDKENNVHKNEVIKTSSSSKDDLTVAKPTQDIDLVLEEESQSTQEYQPGIMDSGRYCGEDPDLFEDCDVQIVGDAREIEELEIDDQTGNESSSIVVLSDSNEDRRSADSIATPSPSSSSLFAKADKVPAKRPFQWDSSGEESAKKFKAATSNFTVIRERETPTTTAYSSKTVSADDEDSLVVNMELKRCPGSSVIMESPDIPCSRITNLDPPHDRHSKGDILTRTPGQRRETFQNGDEAATLLTGKGRRSVSPKKKRQHAGSECDEKTVLRPTEEADDPSGNVELFKVPSCIGSSSESPSPSNSEKVCFTAVATKIEFDKFKHQLIKVIGFHGLNESGNIVNLVRNKRLSELSSLSGGSGYLGDIGSSASSGISGSSQGTQRDRLSLMPDYPIKSHGIVAPVPKQRKLPALHENEEVGDLEAKQNDVSGETNVTPKDEVSAVVKTSEEQAEGEEIKNELKEDVTAFGLVFPNTQEPFQMKRRGKKLMTKRSRNSQRKIRKNGGDDELDGSEEIEVVAPINSQAIESVVGSRLTAGDLVFAKWVSMTDVGYWPGLIAETDDVEFYVKFDDGEEKRGLKREDIIPVASLAPGHLVNVSSEEEVAIYTGATILTHPDYSVNDGDVMFTVDFQRIPELPQIDSQMVSYKRVHLSGEQAKVVKRHLGGVYITSTVNADISLDNLISGKRSSKLATPKRKRVEGLKSPTSHRWRKKGGSLVETSVHEADDGVSSASDGSMVESSKKKFKRETADTSAREKLKEKILLGRSDIFAGLTFVLTQGSHPPAPEDLNTTVSVMESETESEVDKPGNYGLDDTPLFHKRRLRAMLEDHGGKVLQEFPGAKVPIPQGLIVISDRECLTMTYLMAVGFTIPMVSHQWIVQCLKENYRVPMINYLLPVGWSKVDNRLIEQSDRNEQRVRRGIFSPLHLLVSSSLAEFGLDWKPLLTRMGASVSFRSQGKLDRTLKKVSVIIVDEAHPPPSIVEDASSKNVPVVNTDWVIESLMNGSRVPCEQFIWNGT